MSIEDMIGRIVEDKIEAMLPEMIRAYCGSQKPESGASDTSLVGALEIAKLLGRDTSTPKKARAAKLYVYNLARSGYIPSLRLSPKRIMFNPVEVRRRFSV